MNTAERRNQIKCILVTERNATISELAERLQCSASTIKRDVVEISSELPIVTARGKAGGVSVVSWYHPHRNILTKEQHDMLTRVKSVVPESDGVMIDQMLAEFSENYYRRDKEMEVNKCGNAI